MPPRARHRRAARRGDRGGVDGGNVDELRRQEAEDIAHEIDPAINLLRWIADDIDDDTDTDTDTDTEIERGYTFWYSSADVDEDPGLDTFTSPLMYNTEIDVGEKLVRMKLDGSTDVVTVTKITPNCLAVEEETDGLYYLIGDPLDFFPMPRGNSGLGDAILIGRLTNNVVPLVQP